jgi:hypothetical protein
MQREQPRTTVLFSLYSNTNIVLALSKFYGGGGHLNDQYLDVTPLSSLSSTTTRFTQLPSLSPATARFTQLPSFSSARASFTAVLFQFSDSPLHSCPLPVHQQPASQPLSFMDGIPPRRMEQTPAVRVRVSASIGRPPGLSQRYDVRRGQRFLNRTISSRGRERAARSGQLQIPFLTFPPETGLHR